MEATVKKTTTKTPSKKKDVKTSTLSKDAKETKKKSVNLNAKIYDAKGKESGTVKLPESIFGLSWNGDLVHQVVVSMQSNERVSIAHTKDRSEVRGGGAKPWRQKGTGRARHGSRRSPIWVGGGITFGPRKEKIYTKKVNKRMKNKALYTILSRKLKDGEIIFVDNISTSEPKTVEAKKALDTLSKIKGYEKLTTKKKNTAMLLLNERDINTAKSFRNFSNIYVEEFRNINPINLLTYKYLIITKPEDAVKFLESKNK